jgi:hypothetical protein
MTVCVSTGISLPECSCRLCLEGQIREHQPALLAGGVAAIAGARGGGVPVAGVAEPARRAA